MLLLHGGGGHAAVLWPFAALAAERGFEVAVPDLPGYGKTRVPSVGVRYSDWVECIADLVRAEKAADPRPLVVMGASMGGMLAYEAAARRTEVVDAVVATCLLDPRLPGARAVLGRNPVLGAFEAVADALVR